MVYLYIIFHLKSQRLNGGHDAVVFIGLPPVILGPGPIFFKSPHPTYYISVHRSKAFLFLGADGGPSIPCFTMSYSGPKWKQYRVLIFFLVCPSLSSFAYSLISAIFEFLHYFSSSLISRYLTIEDRKNKNQSWEKIKNCSIYHLNRNRLLHVCSPNFPPSLFFPLTLSASFFLFPFSSFRSAWCFFQST